MKVKIAVTAIAAFTSLGLAAPISAMEMDMETVTCPLESMSDEVGAELATSLVGGDGKISDEAAGKLTTLVNDCAKKSGWTADESKLALEFNLSAIAAARLEEMLSEADVNASDYESLLEEWGPDELQAVADGANGNAVIGQAIDRLMKEKNDKTTDEVAGQLGAYLQNAAKAQVIVFKLMGLNGL